ncbi:MAG: glycerol-3-phosphate acyltransferase [Leptospiraceae bacterium]|nr:glycerol-3-phosphate acyltransferase [Leptospiraceae bacterium]
MPTVAMIAVLAVASFANGAMSWAWLFTWLCNGKDIRLVGSGNPGASNVYRECGLPMGLLTMVMDIQKGVTTLLLAAWLLPEFGRLEFSIVQLALGLAAWLGHVYSPLLGFRGGKGVATLIGIYAVVFPLGLVTAILAGLAIMAVYRWFSLGSLIGVTTFPVSYFLLLEQPFMKANFPLLLFIALALVLTWMRHWGNVRRILQGAELRIQGHNQN